MEEQAMSAGIETTARERTWKVVYTIVERGPARKHWVRIGAAFVNQDQSLTVRLDATPTNGLLHIRDPDPARQGYGTDGVGRALVARDEGRSNDWVSEGGVR